MKISNITMLEVAEVRTNLFFGQATISSLRAMTYLGLGFSDYAFRNMYKGSVGDKEDLKREILIRKVNRDKAKAAVDSAAIIYAHAILDATLYRLCEISASIDPEAWIPLVREKSVTFQEVHPNGVSKILEKLVVRRLKQLERESLRKKCELLFRILRPKEVRDVVDGFRYSPERLAEIDQIRHNLIHKLMFHRRVKQASAHIEYLFKIGAFFYNLLASHYGIRIFKEELLRGVIPIADYDETLLTQMRRPMKRTAQTP